MFASGKSARFRSPAGENSNIVPSKLPGLRDQAHWAADCIAPHLRVRSGISLQVGRHLELSAYARLIVPVDTSLNKLLKNFFHRDRILQWALEPTRIAGEIARIDLQAVCRNGKKVTY